MKYSRIFLESSESEARCYDNNHVSRRNRTRTVIAYANGNMSPEKLEMRQTTLLHMLHARYTDALNTYDHLKQKIFELGASPPSTDGILSKSVPRGLPRPPLRK